jgi:hypothetical protein
MFETPNQSCTYAHKSQYPIATIRRLRLAVPIRSHAPTRILKVGLSIQVRALIFVVGSGSTLAVDLNAIKLQCSVTNLKLRVQMNT